MKSKEQKRVEAIERAAEVYASRRHVGYFFDRFPTMDDYLNLFRKKEDRQFPAR